MKKMLYILLQCSWGCLQSLLGFCLFLLNIRCPHRWYHGALITQWPSPSSLSVGMFVFITSEPYFYEKLQDEHSKEELARRLLVHEYGHTIQSLILGPLYLPLMGIPSTLWGFLPACHRQRQHGRSYFDFFTERWANRLGEAVTGEASMEQLHID